MGSDAIARWISNVKDQSCDFNAYLNCNELDDSFGWGTMLKRYLGSDSLQVRSKRGLLLTGPYGCGKHTAAYHAVKHLSSLEEGAFESIFLSGRDFSFDECGLVYEYLNALLDEFNDANQNLCLVLENPELSIQSDELLKWLGQFSCMYSYSDWASLCIIVITENEMTIPQVLRERLHQCRMCLPNRSARIKYLENHVGRILEVLLNDKYTPSVTLDSLADYTENFTYAQLRDLTTNAEMYVQVFDISSEDECERFLNMISEQLPAQEGHTLKEELFVKLISLIDDLPEMLKTLPAAVPQVSMKIPSPEKEEDPLKVTVDEDQFNRETNQMTTEQVAIDVLGEEHTAKLRQRIESLEEQ